QTMGAGPRTVGTSDFFFAACLTYLEEHGLDAEQVEAWEGVSFHALDPWLRIANELPEGQEIDLGWLEELARVCNEEAVYRRFVEGVRAQEG
ncbi:MAG TPA: hypothetical protein VNL92_07755, partial [Dehalococcoidia bacterium]|nr:hypothetical protein [Dehalococcoidia bacterium]